MRGIRPWKWMRTTAAAVALAAVLGGPAGGVRLDAAESAVSAAAEITTEQLQSLFVGRTPSSVAELRAMQEHVQKLIDMLSKCTVGVQVRNAQGSGVIVSKDGYVLTAAHVAGEPNVNATFILSDGRTVRGKTLGLFKTLDAGLMKITDSGEFPCAEMGSSAGLKEGQWCLAMGHPGGYQSDRGVVLRLGRVLLVRNDAITTDCTLVGGDSGGPLFDMEGKVIGINSRIASRLDANMHAPVGAFHDTWDRLVSAEAWGYYPGQRPWIGVGSEEGSSGATIGTIQPDSPASRSKLQVGDVVVKFDGKDIGDFKELVEAVANCQPRQWVTLTVRRGEETEDIRLRIGLRRGE